MRKGHLRKIRTSSESWEKICVLLNQLWRDAEISMFEDTGGT
jgi:hypothetical protein